MSDSQPCRLSGARHSVHSMLPGLRRLLSTAAAVLGNCPLLFSKCVLPLGCVFNHSCSWAFFGDSNTPTWCQVSNCLHNPFNPGSSASTETPYSPLASHGAQVSAPSHDPFMLSKPAAPGRLSHTTKSQDLSNRTPFPSQHINAVDRWTQQTLTVFLRGDLNDFSLKSGVSDLVSHTH